MAILHSFLDGVKEVKIMVSVKANVTPTLRAEGALKD
jgi:hypothetical protein